MHAEKCIMSLEILASASELIEGASQFLQNARAQSLKKQQELIAQNNLAGAIDNATDYLNDIARQVAHGRLTLALSEQNKVGAFVNALTLGYNRKAQNVLFALMRELLRLMEEEMDFAKERVAGLRLLSTAGADSDWDGIKPFL
jgi:hypothetical protein